MSVPDHCSVVSGQDPNWICIQRYGAWIRIKIGVAFQDPNLNWGLDVDPNEGKLQDPDHFYKRFCIYKMAAWLLFE